MSAIRVLAAAVGGVLFAAAGVAAAGNFASDRQVDFFAKGSHQFYVWCGKGGDYVGDQRGDQRRRAQMKLYSAAKAAGSRPRRWPVWQGSGSGSPCRTDDS